MSGLCDLFEIVIAKLSSCSRCISINNFVLFVQKSSLTSHTGFCFE